MLICVGDWVTRDNWSTSFEVVEVKFDGEGVVVVDPEDASQHLYEAAVLRIVPTPTPETP